MLPTSAEGPSTRAAALAPLRPCRACGLLPSAAVQVGRDWTLGWFSCPECGVRTREGLTYPEAWQEWNAVFAVAEPT
ncbi:MAG TPA: hypothetical protein VEG34_12385 [Thermoanaerobaculia bacterium]|nr:hypothetical protein [Thermoanaerobaculia bacterium]